MRVCRDDGFTIGELLVVILIIGVLAALSIAFLKSARMSSNETSAIASMRTIVSAQASYSGAHNAYAGSLDALGMPCPGTTVPFITPELNHNGVTKSGYILNVAPGAKAMSATTDCNGTPTQSAFYATAIPEILDGTGRRAFAANTTSSIWQNTAGVPPTEPLIAAGTVSIVGR